MCTSETKNVNDFSEFSYVIHSTTICKLVDLIPALRQSDCRIPNWVSAKTVHSSSTNCTVRNLHTSGIDASHVHKKRVAST